MHSHFRHENCVFVTKTLCTAERPHERFLLAHFGALRSKLQCKTAVLARQSGGFPGQSVVIFTRDRYVVISVRFLSPLKIESSKSQRLRLAFFVPIFRVPTQPPPSLPFCSFSSRYLGRCRVLRSRLLNSQHRSFGLFQK